MKLPEKIILKLTQSRLTLACAESCTGGLLSNLLTDVAGSSKVFKGGVITYSDECKEQILRIPEDILHEEGAVSEQVACLMAQHVKRLIPADFGIGITGIAGPNGGTKTKPVGLVYIAVASPHQTICEKHIFKGNRLANKKSSAKRALEILLDIL